ncbi:MAG: hypothetical protein EOO56_11860 [Hymenobacter sp.]|nr:MAG: hypothetical protein EOO56_11860 [Hymenobacter sp.]
MFHALYLLAMFLVAAAATLAFKSLMGRHIASEALRITTVGLFFFAMLAGWNLWMSYDTDIAGTYKQPMNEGYYFTIQSFLDHARESSELTFYQHRFWWFDKKLGFIALEGVDMLAMDAKIRSEAANSYRLTVTSRSVVVVDTVLPEGQPFNFQRRVSNP